MERYTTEDLTKKHVQLDLLETLILYKDKNLSCMYYSDGTLIIEESQFEESPEIFSELIKSLQTEKVNVAVVGVADSETITKEINRARKEDIAASTSAADDSEAQAIAEEIITHAVNNNCSDVHIYIRNPNVEIRYNQHGSATSPLFTKFDYNNLIRMTARLFNWDGANNSVGEFNLANIQNTTLTMSIKKDDGAIATRLRIEKSPLERKGDVKVVFRVSPAVQSKTLPDLQVMPHIADLISAHMKKPNGMVIISGPTGSGKTTLLHASLHEIPSTAFCSTVEDPVELLADFNPLICQHNLDTKIGYNGQLRSILRQDPNIIVIGEMRDEETAQSSMRASLTGHLVLTTLHTNNALGIPARLDDLGVPYKEQAQPDVLSLLVAIRLSPVLCQHCAKPLSSDFRMLNKIKTKEQANVEHIKVKHKQGCKHCIGGIKGRKSVIEVINVDQGFREHLGKGDLKSAKEYLKSHNWKSLQDLAWDEINQGTLDPQDAESTFKDIIDDTDKPFDYSMPGKALFKNHLMETA